MAETKVKRHPERGHYDRETIDAILDDGFLCHLVFVVDVVESEVGLKPLRQEPGYTERPLGEKFAQQGLHGGLGDLSPIELLSNASP